MKKKGWPGQGAKPGQPVGGPRSRRTMHGAKAELIKALGLGQLG
jgi:hypothetical protein